MGYLDNKFLNKYEKKNLKIEKNFIDVLCLIDLE
jgi:hypothetical protein